MTYYLDLFSLDTYERFLASDRTIAGFDDKARTRSAAQRVRSGDKFLCYITGLKRWAATLEVVSGPFRDGAPRFADRDDPYVTRFLVNPRVVLPLERAVPIDDERVWSALSFTREHPKGSSNWTAPIRNPLNRIDDADGKLLETLLHAQASTSGRTYAIDPKQLRRLARRRERSTRSLNTAVKPPSAESSQGTVRKPDAVPSATASGRGEEPANEGRESIRMQARLAEIGSRMGMDIWIPPGDRRQVVEHLPSEGGRMLDHLPLVASEPRVLKTIEQIDVLWLKGRSIVRAFEVEHTTAVYSGLLRMADLLALQPNTNFQLHIVAPSDRRTKVLQEIRRPAFNTGPFRLEEQCSFISYEKLNELHAVPLLSHLSDTVLKEYEERA